MKSGKWYYLKTNGSLNKYKFEIIIIKKMIMAEKASATAIGYLKLVLGKCSNIRSALYN